MSQTLDASSPYALVVDDDGLIRMDAMDILEDAGFRTLEADDGDKALDLLAQQHGVIVLLFTDVQMPGTRNGFAVARETARQWPPICIVVASGHVQPGPDDMPDAPCSSANRSRPKWSTTTFRKFCRMGKSQNRCVVGPKVLHSHLVGPSRAIHLLRSSN